MGHLLHDLRHAARRLLRRPTVSLPALAALSLAGAGMLLVLSLVEGVLLRPLAYPEADRLQFLSWRYSPGEQFPRAMTAAQARFFIDHSRSFSDIGSWADAGSSFTLSGGGGALADRVAGVRVDAGLLPALAMPPQAGRGFSPQEARDRAAVVVLSPALARQRFGGIEQALGAELALDGVGHRVVGVLAEGFRFDPPVDLMIPAEPGGAGAGGSNTYVVGRLADGVDADAARAELAALSRAYGEAGGDRGPRGEAFATVVGLKQVIVGDSARFLLPLAGAVLLLALLACLNTANLLLGMQLARGGDLAVESALGATRARQLRDLMLQALLLVASGLGLALALSALLLPLVPGWLALPLPRLDEVGLHGSTLAMLALAGILMLVVVALVSVSGFGCGTRVGHGQRGGRRVGLQPWLVAAQVALSCVLLSGAALMLASFDRLASTAMGFRVAGIGAVELALSDARYRDPVEATARTVQLLEALETELAATPGVRAWASASSLPLQRGLNNYIEVPAAGADAGASVELRMVSRDYFSVLEVPLRRGRGFDARDRAGGEPVAVVNEAFARRFFGDDPGAALGQTLRMGELDLRVVGLAADMRELSLRQPAEPTVFMARAQLPAELQSAVNRWFDTALLVEHGEGLALEQVLREALARIDPGVALVSVRPLAAVRGQSLALERFSGALLSGFALLALLLAGIGLYGVLGQLQQLRRHELAVRLALGARALDNAGRVLGQGLRWVVFGLLAGLPLALLVPAALEGLRSAGGLADLPWVAAALVLLVLVAALAAALPAGRCLRIQPARALREE